MACHTKGKQDQFIRIVWRDGELTLHNPGAPGRSAYICQNPICVDRALKKDALARALRKPVSSETKERLKQELECRLR